jgi:hypothetical protein
MTTDCRVSGAAPASSYQVLAEASEVCNSPTGDGRASQLPSPTGRLTMARSLRPLHTSGSATKNYA